jgi:alanyl-tRNA synthetase
MPSSTEIRDAFRTYFHERGHEIVASAPLVPRNDPTLMFVNAGMVQFKDVFTGKDRRPYKRATSAQKCIRISGKHNDLENVGVTARHHTFFEMLGNFSFGDYFKQEAIAYAWEFLTRTVGLDRNRMLVSVFGGDEALGLAPDDEAAAFWKKLAGVPDDRIHRLGLADNFWAMGDTGPCGPCSEIYYWFGHGAPDLSRFGGEPDEAGTGWVELWNCVFMQFVRHMKESPLEKLPAPSVDTGMGLERLTCAMQGVVSNYDTDLHRPVIELAAGIARKKYGGTLAPDDISIRVIADHARLTAFLIAEGVFPDRDEREYVLRRVMRRAVRHGHRLGIERPFLHECALRVVDVMGGEYPELVERRALIEDIARQEEERFRATLKRGLERLATHQFPKGAARILPGSVAFELYDTFGFPLDLQEVIGREQGFAIDNAGFEAELERAREKSAGSKVGEAEVAAVYREVAAAVGATKFLGYECERADVEIVALCASGGRVDVLTTGQSGEVVARQTPFYAESGGQVGDRGEIRTGAGRFVVEDTQRPVEGLVVHRGRVAEGSVRAGEQAAFEVDHAARSATRRNHSATHLLHLALRKVVGPHAMQKGSLVGPDRLRLDYSGAKPLTAEQIREIEDIVNARVLDNHAVTTDVLPIDEAKTRGAIGIFEEKYGDVVRMLTIADSKELCGGTHVARTGDIGAFKVLSESGIAAGVRRVEAGTGLNVLAHTRALERELEETAALLKTSAFSVREKTQRLLDKEKEQAREIQELQRKLLAGGAQDFTAGARKVGDVTVLGARVEVGDPNALRELADKLRDKMAPAVVVLGAPGDGKVTLICTVSKEITGRFRADKLIREIASVVGGGGGGRADFAQAGGSDVTKLDEAVERVYDLVTPGHA